LIDAREPAGLGVPEPVVGFSERPSPNRHLALNGKPAYELSWGCGTCALLFRRLDGANEAVSVDHLREKLSRRADAIDAEVVDAFGALLAAGEYVTLLVEVTPRLVAPGRDGDYFADEQVATWGLSAFTGLPEYPNVAYYRTGQYDLAARERMFELGLPSKPVTTAPRSRSAVRSGPAPHPASRTRRPATSPARFRIAGRA
jgi:hypothetical protein